MKHLPSHKLCLAAAVAFSFAAAADPPVVTLNGVAATTSTSAQGVVTSNGASVDASVRSAAGGTYTVLLEEQAADGAPWTLVATMANCAADGTGTVNGVAATVCGFSTLAPKYRTRLRVSAYTSGTIYGVIHVNRSQP